MNEAWGFLALVAVVIVLAMAAAQLGALLSEALVRYGMIR